MTIWRPPSNASTSVEVERWQTSADGLSLGSTRWHPYRVRGGESGGDQLLSGGQRVVQSPSNFRRQLGVHISSELPQTGMNNTLYLFKIVQKSPHLGQTQCATLP